VHIYQLTQSYLAVIWSYACITFLWNEAKVCIHSACAITRQYEGPVSLYIAAATFNYASVVKSCITNTGSSSSYWGRLTTPHTSAKQNNWGVQSESYRGVITPDPRQIWPWNHVISFKSGLTAAILISRMKTEWTNSCPFQRSRGVVLTALGQQRIRKKLAQRRVNHNNNTLGDQTKATVNIESAHVVFGCTWPDVFFQHVE